MSAPNDVIELVNAIALAIDEKFGGEGVSPTLDGQYPDDVCKALANIKVAIDNFGEGTPSSEHYPDDLCKALANVESKICSAQGGGGGSDLINVHCSITGSAQMNIIMLTSPNASDGLYILVERNRDGNTDPYITLSKVPNYDYYVVAANVDTISGTYETAAGGLYKLLAGDVYIKCS